MVFNFYANCGRLGLGVEFFRLVNNASVNEDSGATMSWNTFLWREVCTICIIVCQLEFGVEDRRVSFNSIMSIFMLDARA